MRFEGAALLRWEWYGVGAKHLKWFTTTALLYVQHKVTGVIVIYLIAIARSLPVVADP